jgi:outer membrane protein assembly factor BamB
VKSPAALPALLIGLVLSAAGAAHADNWPQWRGPAYDGVSKETNLPAEWSDAKNVAWKLPLPGAGSSTPVVWGDRIFLTSEDSKDLVLMCVSTAGKELWKQKLGNPDKRVGPGGQANLASGSPCTDGKHVWATVGTGDLACFDLDGKEVWKFNLQDRYGRFRIQFGMHTTPLLHGDRLYLQLIHSGGAWVVALDKATGKEVWKVERKSDGRAECEHSYASPCLWTNGKDAYLIVHGNDYATAHRLDDGSEIWRVGDLNPKDHYNPTLRFVASPVAVADLIVVPSAKNGPVVGLKPDATGLVGAGGAAEKWRRPRFTPDVPSPLVHDGLVYLCREDGHLDCLDAKTGKEYYSQRLHPALYRASPVFADGKVYCAARDGIVSVVKAGRKFQLLAANSVGDRKELCASPAVSGGRIYLRYFDALYAIELESR